LRTSSPRKKGFENIALKRSGLRISSTKKRRGLRISRPKKEGVWDDLALERRLTGEWSKLHNKDFKCLMVKDVPWDYRPRNALSTIIHISLQFFFQFPAVVKPRQQMRCRTFQHTTFLPQLNVRELHQGQCACLHISCFCRSCCGLFH
jgi:hypothetical protein